MMNQKVRYEEVKKEAIFVCPDCGREFIKRIDTVCANGLSCPCNDKWSYPNKFMYSLLEQLNLDFTPEKTFEWSDGRRYDEYIVIGDKTILIEVQGLQHYEKPIIKSDKHRSVYEEQENDKLKYNLAMDNGIDFYFVIDCRESNMNYIKKSIITSGLLDILFYSDSDIDWNRCDEFATSNFIKHVCEYYESHNLTVAEVAEYFKLSRKTIQRYLNKGNNLGWCNYNDKNISLSNISNHKKKAVYCKTIDMKFDSATDAAKYLNLPDAEHQGRSIRNSIKFNRPYFNYVFEYAT
jgi:AraC-like DNA-binding protein